MAHIKAEYLKLVCCNRLLYPRTTNCDSQNEHHMYCDRTFGDLWEIDEHCKHSKFVRGFMERTYKQFEATEHDGTWDEMFGFYDLTVSRGKYLCSYLEIDGVVYCDEREEIECYMRDPRIEVDK